MKTVSGMNSANAIKWAQTTDVVVIGLGAAGIACALEAIEGGASVVALDKYEGGGATVASGGVIYAGGGTSIQKEAGIIDDPQNMFAYLKHEVGSIISDETLMDFCQQSAPTIDWMRGHGVDLRPEYWPHKTSYPAPEYFLYHSDNSLLSPYKDDAKPAARGHRGYVPIAQGRKAQNLGGALFNPLKSKAVELGLEIKTFSEARDLVMDDTGRVIGIKVMHFADNAMRSHYKNLRAKAARLMTIYPPILPGFSFFMKKALAVYAQAARLEAERETYFIRARKGVLLSAGGFVFNRKMVKTHAPGYAKCFPLGTDGDNGSGIKLGQKAGGATSNMNRMTAWRFINPPLAFARGAIVNMSGNRFINEMVYGATLGVEMVENHDGKAWLILDKPLIKQSLKDVSGNKALAFQKALAKLNVYFGAVKARTLSDLAEKIEVPAKSLESTLENYNGYSRGIENDPFRKATSDIAPILKPPFYAIDIGVAAKLFPCPALTLGGLNIDEATGHVKSEAGEKIPGLYAAGRNAIGVASWNYVSGLSIADGIYSGRRAGRSMAKQSH